MCVGFEGMTPVEAPLAELADLAPGGVILFARNARDVASVRVLADAVTAAVGRSPRSFVGIDQEGGRVARLRRGAAQMPSMMALAASGDLDLARRVGSALAWDLRRAGCDVDFAPVVDLALEPRSTVIGARSFGDDPERVGSFGAALAEGLQASGVAAVLKHFPGHGSTAVDSHLALPVVNAPADILRARDLIPFARGIAAGAKAVMAAHVVVPAFDAHAPATLSHALLTDLLRKELGFTGVCFTDCLEMDAIAAGIGTVQGAVRAIAAGADCVLVSHRLELARAVRDAIVEAVQTRVIPLERLEEAACRVRALRAWLAESAGAELFGDGPAIAAEAARRAVTRVRGSIRLDPNVPVTVVSFEGVMADGVQSPHADEASLNMALRTRHFRSELFRVPLEPEPELIEQLTELVRAQAGRQFVFLLRRAHLHAAQSEAVETLLAEAPQALIASVREPFDVACVPQARHVVCTYGDEEVSVEALADALSGRIDPVGVLPVAL